MPKEPAFRMIWELNVISLAASILTLIAAGFIAYFVYKLQKSWEKRVEVSSLIIGLVRSLDSEFHSLRTPFGFSREWANPTPEEIALHGIGRQSEYLIMQNRRHNRFQKEVISKIYEIIPKMIVVYGIDSELPLMSIVQLYKDVYYARVEHDDLEKEKFDDEGERQAKKENLKFFRSIHTKRSNDDPVEEKLESIKRELMLIIEGDIVKSKLKFKPSPVDYKFSDPPRKINY